MQLINRKPDGSFGSFFGHPDGSNESERFIRRMLREFKLDFEYFEELILSIPMYEGEYVTALQPRFQTALEDRGWKKEPAYPESNYRADFGLEQDRRWIFVEIELSDIRRAVNAFYMARVFRTGYMRVGIFIAPETDFPEKGKKFYSSLVMRYRYLAPEYPLWVIGFTYP